MINSPCQHLDGFVGQWLDNADQSSFEQHLASCPNCRAKVELYRAVDSALVEAWEAEKPPVGLTARIERQLISRQRNQRWLVGIATTAAAAALVGALLIPQFLNPSRDKPASASMDINQQRPTSHGLEIPSFSEIVEQDLPQPTVEFPRDVIAIHYESSNPNVTLVRIYQDYKQLD